jgi:hypothetical protein
MATRGSTRRRIAALPNGRIAPERARADACRAQGDLPGRASQRRQVPNRGWTAAELTMYGNRLPRLEPSDTISHYHFPVESAPFALLGSGTTATALSFQTVIPRRRTTR